MCAGSNPAGGTKGFQRLRFSCGAFCPFGAHSLKKAIHCGRVRTTVHRDITNGWKSKVGFQNGAVMSDIAPPLITLAAVCEELSISRSTANAWRRDGRFPKGKRLPNGHVRYAPATVAAFIDSLEIA